MYRQYEEKQLKTQQERAQKRLEFSNQGSKLKSQVLYIVNHAVTDGKFGLVCKFDFNVYLHFQDMHGLQYLSFDGQQCILTELE